MNIGFDITSLLYDRGVSRYTGNLIRALIELGEDEISVFGSSVRGRKNLYKQALALGVSDKNIVIKQYPTRVLELMWRYNQQKIKTLLPQAEVFHTWDWLQPPDRTLPLVSTIHDLAILKYPETAHPDVLAHHQQSWDILRQRRAHIIAVSQSTREDIIELLDFPENRVHVITEALPLETIQTAEQITAQEQATISKKFNLEKPYILAVGTREPRKNLDRLIKAWKPLAQQIDLLIAGEKGWDTTENYSLPQLRLLGKVTDTELHVLYQKAKALAYPSLYEGFGFPILEAYYHKTPVVTATTSAMPEVAGDAAILVDPFSVRAIRSGLETLLQESPADQKKRLEAMQKQYQRFSWQSVAQQTRLVYQTALADAS